MIAGCLLGMKRGLYEPYLDYNIGETESGLRIEQYLRRQGYSRQNLTELKKMPESVLVNGTGCILKKALSAGDLVRSEKYTNTKRKINGICKALS